MPPFMPMCVHDLPGAPLRERGGIGPTGTENLPRTPPVVQFVLSRGMLHTGYKISVGDLPPWVTVEMLRHWFCLHPALREVGVIDLSVNRVAASGAGRAIMTFRTPEEASAVHAFFWAVRTPSDIDVAGWRWVTVRVFTDAQQGGKR